MSIHIYKMFLARGHDKKTAQKMYRDYIRKMKEARMPTVSEVIEEQEAEYQRSAL